MFNNKYRIVTDEYSGLEAQCLRWWFPFVYMQISDRRRYISVNTHQTIEKAKENIERHKSGLKPVRFRSQIVELLEDE